MQEATEELDLLRAFVKGPVWDLLSKELTKRRHLTAVELRKPALNMRGMIRTETLKAQLNEIEFLMVLPLSLVDNLEAEVNRSPQDEH